MTEDAGTSTLDDATSTCCTLAEAAMLPALWLTFTTAGLLSDATPRPGLSDAMARIRVSVMLVASPDEARANRIYHAAAPETSELWQLPAGTPHTGGLAAHPHAYERRLSAFFVDNLLRWPGLPDGQK